MYLHRSGFAPQETLATHQRRRYRLTPGPHANPNIPPCDPSLWIIHYSQADLPNHFPANRIAISGPVQSIITERRYLQQHDQLVRKEFMLHDRNSWPTINLPANNPRQQPIGYPSNVISHMNRQQGYGQQRNNASNPPGPPPAKRQRQNNSTAAEVEAHAFEDAMKAAMNRELTIYEEEDVSKGDLLDFLTPRDISTMRYKQHHEWLDEVFKSPYDTQQIVPGQLGLGRKGELEALTRDFFDAPTIANLKTSNKEPQPPSHVGRLEAGRAEDFTKKATERIAEINAEIEKMKRQHARRMAKLAKGVAVREAEQALSQTSLNTSNTSRSNSNGQVDEIKSNIESTIRRKVGVVKHVEYVQKGGLEEKNSDIEQISQDYELLDQTTDLSHQVPSFQAPKDPISSGESTPGHATHRAVSPNLADESVNTVPITTVTDVAMTDSVDVPQVKEAESGDWIIVNKNVDSEETQDEQLPGLDTFTNDAAIGSAIGTPGEALETADDNLPNFGAETEGDLGADFGSHDFTEGVDFGPLDTAGEALSGYGEEDGMGMDDHGDLGLDDSAFGDAFHSNETDTGNGDTMP